MISKLIHDYACALGRTKEMRKNDHSDMFRNWMETSEKLLLQQFYVMRMTREEAIQVLRQSGMEHLIDKLDI